jgi:hypothetical protein
MGHFIANKRVQKLFQISDTIALTTAGLVGHAQSLSRTLAAELRLYELKHGTVMTVKGAATLTANILVGRPHYVQLLIAGIDDSGGSVYSIDSAGGSIPDLYCATGSGSPFMYGVLEDQFSEGMSQDDTRLHSGPLSMRRERRSDYRSIAANSISSPGRPQKSRHAVQAIRRGERGEQWSALDRDAERAR